MNRVLIGLGVAALAAVVGLYALFFAGGNEEAEKKTPAPVVDNDRPPAKNSA